MADPSSIASGVREVMTATTQTYSLIVKFIRECKESRADLTHITRELSDLKLVLELIRDDNADDATNPLPDALQSSVQVMLTNCKTVMRLIEETLDRCRRKPGPLLWTRAEMDKAVSLKVSLEAYKNSLNLALETMTMSTMQDIEKKAEEAPGSEHELQQRNYEILDEFYRFRDQVLPGYPFSQEQDQERRRLEQWLDALTHYAEGIATSRQPRDFLGIASIAEETAEPEELEDGEEPDPHEEAANYVLEPTTTPPPPPPPAPQTSRYALPFPGLPARTYSSSSTGGRISGSGSRGHDADSGDFAVLEAYDPHWRDHFGPFLAKEGLADDDIRADQDFIVELMQYLAQQESDRPKWSSSSRGGQGLRTAKIHRGSGLEKRRRN
ncbi:hypothetical protein F5Y14DRAFT_422635 [Nemania sp. NC0429]|nr:hypothetical protein F5Y14DRAFT_422635 [Nemania sp. NC0429]